MYIVLAIILVGIMFVGIFVIGALFSRHILLDALEDARHDQLRQEYYRMAGVRTPTDPKPYVPPRIRPVAPQTRQFIPGMSIMTLVPGGFFVFAIVMAFVHFITRDKSKIKQDFGCAGCAMEATCTSQDSCAQKGAE